MRTKTSLAGRRPLPMNNKDAYYFPHDSNAKDDPKCMLVIEQVGLEGYGIYWMLIETLRDQPDYTYPVANIPALARRYNTTADKVRSVVYDYGLFVVKDDQAFWSESLNRRMRAFNEKRAKRSEAGRIGMARRWGDNNAITSLSQKNNSVITSKVKESKLNKIKVNNTTPKNTNVFIPPSLDEVVAYFEEKGYTRDAAERAYAYYTERNWVDSKGAQVKNWKSKCIAVWFQPENRKPESAETDRPWGYKIPV